MNAPATPDALRTPFGEARIPDALFARMRKANLARWPTGAEVDFGAAVERHQSLPAHKQLARVLREADAEGRCLTQPRGGFGTFELQRELMQILDRDGHADIVPTTTDSYTRNEQWQLAQKGVEESERMGRSMLNGYPMVNYGVAYAQRLIDAIDKPAIMLTGTAMPKLTGEIGYAAGYSGYLGSGIAYTVSYTKELSIEEGIRNYQYLDRLVAMYQDAGVELHRRQPGFLTGTNIPPSIAIVSCVLDCLLAAAQGGLHPNGRRTYGHSLLIDPWGDVVAERDEGPGIVVGDVEQVDEPPADVAYEVLCRQHHRRRLTAARAKAVSLAPEPLPFN